MKEMRHCTVKGCTCDTAHHHLDECDGNVTPCGGKVNDYDQYERTCCQLGPRYLPNPCPHGPDDPCTCTGCWACAGSVRGCTCDIDWEGIAEGRLTGGWK